MGKAELAVELLHCPDRALDLIYSAARQCYSPDAAADIFAHPDGNAAKRASFVKKVVASGHESPLEHIQLSFAVAGVSRALTHQLVRHRLASYSHQSQRYVKADHFDYVVPPSVASDPQKQAVFDDTIKTIQTAYNRLLKLYAGGGTRGEKANQDARFLLPQAAETKIVVSMNCRELRHFFRLRCCNRAQWEIRALANRMRDLCRQSLPAVFETAGPPCEDTHICPEGAAFSCGRYPTA
jgi:thymidylate synthase (FAD)